MERLLLCRLRSTPLLPSHLGLSWESFASADKRKLVEVKKLGEPITATEESGGTTTSALGLLALWREKGLRLACFHWDGLLLLAMPALSCLLCCFLGGERSHGRQPSHRCGKGAASCFLWGSWLLCALPLLLCCLSCFALP